MGPSNRVGNESKFSNRKGSGEERRELGSADIALQKGYLYEKEQSPLERKIEPYAFLVIKNRKKKGHQLRLLIVRQTAIIDPFMLHADSTHYFADPHKA